MRLGYDVAIFTVAVVSFGLGYLLGEDAVKRSIVVRQGFPYYRGGFYGTCAKVRDIQTNLIGEACGTMDQTP